MNADGTNRRRVAEFGAPFWSPDGTQLLINRWCSSPPTRMSIDFATNRTTRINVPGQKIFSWPRWAGPGTLVACIGDGQEPDSIVLLDVSRALGSEGGAVRSGVGPQGPDVHARWPLFSPSSGDCFFIGDEGRRRTLYSLSPTDDGPGRLVRPRGRRPQAEQSQPLSRRPISPLRRGPAGPRALRSGTTVNHERSRSRSRPPGRGAEAKPAPARREGWRADAALHAGPARGQDDTDRRRAGPRPDLDRAPDWSHDGTRIVFDTSPGKDCVKSRMMMMETRDGKPSVRDLGAGNCAEVLTRRPEHRVRAQRRSGAGRGVGRLPHATPTARIAAASATSAHRSGRATADSS